jgi:cell division topological specificity factor
MSFLARLFFGERKKTAAIAKNRLAILIAHERTPNSGRTDYIPAMKDELLQVISKYVNVDPDAINIQFSKQDNYDVMEVNVVLPEDSENKHVKATPPPRVFGSRRPHKKH